MHQNMKYWFKYAFEQNKIQRFSASQLQGFVMSVGSSIKLLSA